MQVHAADEIDEKFIQFKCSEQKNIYESSPSTIYSGDESHCNKAV